VDRLKRELRSKEAVLKTLKEKREVEEGKEAARKRAVELAAKADINKEAEATESAVRMAKAFVKDGDRDGAQRYLAPLVKAGKLAAEEADKIISGG
jgi:hypothetical protein